MQVSSGCVSLGSPEKQKQQGDKTCVCTHVCYGEGLAHAITGVQKVSILMSAGRKPREASGVV